jgi:putative membrane protein
VHTYDHVIKRKELILMKKIASLVAIMLVPLLTMCGRPYGPMMGGGDRIGNYGCGLGLGYGYGGMFMGILFIIVLGIAVYFIFQYIRSTKGVGPAQETPLDILKKRYAKGEITKEEFERIKNELQ